MTSMIRKLAAPLMPVVSSAEATDAAEHGVVSSLTGLTLGFAMTKVSLGKATPFALIGLGLVGDGASLHSGMSHSTRERTRAVGDATLAVGCAELCKSIGRSGVGSHHGEMGPSHRHTEFGMLETSSSFGADAHDPMMAAASKL